MNQTKFSSPAFTTLDSKHQAEIRDTFKLLILLFWGQGGKKNWKELVHNSRDVWRKVESIPGMDNLSVIQTIDDLLEKYPSQELELELESEFVRVFINTRGGVSAPLYHSCYHDDENMLMNKPALKMAEFIEQAGMDLGPEVGEPPDHLCIELEYLFFLLNQPHIHSDPELSGHLRMFAREFMLPWIAMFQQRIPGTGICRFFSHTALAMNELIRFLGRSASGGPS